MARRPGAPAAYGEDFSFVSPLVKYLLFFFNMLFWVSLGGYRGTWDAGHSWRVEWAASSGEGSFPDARFKANVVSGTV